jgi:hypothetical protein
MRCRYNRDAKVQNKTGTTCQAFTAWDEVTRAKMAAM